jgi:hypothetical protein
VVCTEAKASPPVHRDSPPVTEEEGKGGRKEDTRRSQGGRRRAAAADRSSEVTRSALETFCLAVGGFAEPKRCEDPFALNG